MATPSEEKVAVDQARKFHPSWVFALASVVILSALAAGISYIFFLQRPDYSQYLVVVILIFFAISTVSSLLFSTQTKIESALLGITFSVIGPAALWLVSLLFFFYLVPPPNLELADRPANLEMFTSLLTEAEARFGWIDYENVKKQLKGYIH